MAGLTRHAGAVRPHVELGNEGLLTGRHEARQDKQAGNRGNSWRVGLPFQTIAHNEANVRTGWLFIPRLRGPLTIQCELTVIRVSSREAAMHNHRLGDNAYTMHSHRLGDYAYILTVYA